MFKIEMINKNTGKRSYFYFVNNKTRFFKRTIDRNQATSYDTLEQALSDVKFFTEECKFATSNKLIYDFNIVDKNNKKYSHNENILIQ